MAVDFSGCVWADDRLTVTSATRTQRQEQSQLLCDQPAAVLAMLLKSEDRRDSVTEHPSSVQTDGRVEPKGESLQRSRVEGLGRK
jgi:hypothetical protein